MQQAEPNHLLDAKSLASYLSVSTRTLENMLLRGDGPPYVRLGRQRRWRPVDVEAWLQERAERMQPVGSR
jgi:excisionase family DNA binding protein